MDAKQFLAEFGHIANAPGGIRCLRNLVLNYAIQGKLSITQDADTEISVLVKSNEEIREKLIHEGKLRRKHKPIDIDEKEIPWLLPQTWGWFRLGALTNYGDSQQVVFDDVDSDNWILELEDIQKVSSKLISKVFVRERKFKSTKNEFKKGSVLYGKLRPYLDKVIVADDDGVCSTEITPITFFYGINAFYLRWYLKSPFFVEYASNSTYGMNLPRMGTESARLAPFPLPPLEEQSRIVAKVDELMALCDKLEAQQQKKRKLQNKLRQSVLQAVANAESPKELQDSWERLAGNFSHLFAEEADVADFKGMILDLAVSGQLLKYGKIDATGEDVLSLVKEERLKWAAESEDQELKEAQAMIKKIRNQKIIFPDAPLPKHWTWGSFLQISQAVIDCHNKTAPYVSDGIHLVRTTDIRDGKMDLRNTKKITEETYAYWARRMPPRSGDIFFTREAPMGEVAIVPEGEKVCLGQRTMLIRLFPHLFNNQFLVYVIQSPGFQKRMLEDAIGMTVKHLRVGGVEDLIVPIPPKNEQDKLVELIRDLFKKCDRFHNQLQRERIISANLATAAVASLTGISTLQQEEPMKVPKTELKAPVRLGTVQPSSNTQAPLASLLARHNGEMGANDLWQRFGGEIDTFYAQLKTEVMHGWIAEPTGAQMLEKEAD